MLKLKIHQSRDHLVEAIDLIATPIEQSANILNGFLSASVFPW
jgi:hypothetical protein